MPLHLRCVDITAVERLRCWECKTRHPIRKFTLKTGTIFEDSPIGFGKWLPVVWMVANAKNGISSHEVARATGVTQKTAWFMLQPIRLAMQNDNGGEQIGGEVEIDRRRVGVKGGRGRAGKVAVMDLLERHGKDGLSRVRTRILTDLTRKHIQSHVREHVEPGASLHTEAYESYEGLSRDYVRNVIDHA